MCRPRRNTLNCFLSLQVLLLFYLHSYSGSVPSRPLTLSVRSSQWLWRKRKAIVLLCFGVVSGITCTDAILGAVKQEAAVVYLAQQLVAHEAVVAETAKVQQKARAAVTAMSAVELAAKELGQANVNASGTFSKLQQAAAQLEVIAGGAGGTAGANGTSKNGNGKGTQTSQGWGLQTLVKEHKQHAAETKVFKAVEQTLVDVRDELRRTVAGVATVVMQLDAAIAQLSNSGGSGSGSAAIADAAGAGVDAAASAESSGTTAGAGPKLHSDGDGSGAGSLGSGSVSASGSASSTRDRANDLAQELGKALGAFSDVAGNATMAGKSLTQVRSTAVSTLVALNQTIAVLDNVAAAVDAAKKSNKHDDEIKKAAALAMQLALNATATSALAMQLTGEALQRSATEEANELLGMLVQVSRDLEKTSARSKVAKAKWPDGSNTTTAAAAMAAATDTASALGAVSTGAAFTVEEQAAADAAESTVSIAVGGNSTEATAAGSLAANGNATINSAASTSDQRESTETRLGTNVSGAGAAGEGALVELGGSHTGGAGNTGGSAGSVESPAGTQIDRAAEAAGQLEQVIKDLNSKIAAANTATVSTGDAASAQAAAAAAAAAATAAAASALAATGAGGGKTAVKNLDTDGGKAAVEGALVDLSGVNGGTAKTTTAADSVAGGGSAGLGSGNLNVSGIAAVLQDAVAVTKVKQDEALQEIKQSLTSTDAVVAERVVDILKDLSETQKGDAVGKGFRAASAGSGSAVEAVLTGGGGESAVAAAVAAGGATAGGSSSGGGMEATLLGLVHKIKDSVSHGTDGLEKVEGPVVKVDKEGNLIQEDGDGDGVVGPTVKDTDAQLSSSTSSSGSRDLKKADKYLSHSGAKNSSGNESGANSTSGGGGSKLRKLGLGLGLTAGRPR
ncbi:hypothetical protein Vretimale_10277 [Volvox reticuliferus]|uniref:Methyl-accepting transducer domain-containing protein n=1 Tax=Volvox reticuliferus TaxID=1737510 RepID=A0A8J4BYF7_9CHLO|nr:hypothetical protein Vretifemale_563 [Volvox reticuliferus]GIM05855.1 hypothetical protein Vretimale_10277 [Volvox reticuliferus]